MYKSTARHQASILPSSQISDKLITAHLQLFVQIEAINRRWFDRLAQTRESERALGSSLLQCVNALEAGTLVSEWMRRQSALFASDMQAYRDIWLDFCNRLSPVSTSNPDGETVTEQ